MDGILHHQGRIAVSGPQEMARRNQAEIVLTARDRTKSAFRAVNQNLGRFASIGLAGAAAGVALLTRASLQQIDALAKQARLLGTTTEALAAFKLVAQKTGIEEKTLEKSLINVTRVVAEAAEGTGLATDTLKKLGLEAKALSQQKPEDQFLSIADAMKGLNTQSEKVLAAYELFGGRGAALLRTLEAGSDAFDEARRKTELYGTAISQVDAASIEEANDALTDMREAIKGVGFDLARRFAPGMKAASESSTGFIVTIRRDFIPAMALLLEQMDLIVSNVRGLSDIELLVRVQVGEDDLAEIDSRLEAASKKAKQEFSSFDVLGGAQVSLDAQNTTKLEAEKAAIEDRLAEVKSEMERRAEVIRLAEEKIAAQTAAQKEEARLTALETERAADVERFDERLELEQERNQAFIKLSLDRAKAERRLRFQEAREEQRAAINRGKLEERAARNTIRLRQATVSTSINILQTLAAKNKTVSRALFIVEKGLAIARTVQNTAAASVRALADLGPIAGPPAAAAIQAFGVAQVGLIAATALTGVSAIGGSAGSIGIGGGNSFEAGDFSGGDGFDTESASVTGVGVNAAGQGVVQLVFPSLFGITPEAIDAIADALRDASENRDIVVVSGSGRNAELLNGANS